MFFFLVFFVVVVVLMELCVATSLVWIFFRLDAWRLSRFSLWPLWIQLYELVGIVSLILIGLLLLRSFSEEGTLFLIVRVGPGCFIYATHRKMRFQLLKKKHNAGQFHEIIQNS